MSPDLNHREPGWAIATAKSDVLALAKEFGQLAIFWVEGDRLFLVPCVDLSHHEEEIGTWSAAVLPPQVLTQL